MGLDRPKGTDVETEVFIMKIKAAEYFTFTGAYGFHSLCGPVNQGILKLQTFC